MENASKALIIAGAIVLSVLIVGLGFYFYNQASGMGKSFSMTEYEIKNHNSQFESYEGVITGAEARELYDKVYQYNISQEGKAGVILTNTKTLSINGNAYTLEPGFIIDAHSGEFANNYMMTSKDAVQKDKLILGKFYSASLYKDQRLGIIAFIMISEK